MIQNPLTDEQPGFVEFFSGIGLIRSALEPLGWRCALANDFDRNKAEIYSRNFGSDHLLVGDIAALGGRDIPHGTRLATACFPCIDLSLAGNRSGLRGAKSGVFWEFLRLLSESSQMGRQIPFLLIENVVGFLSSHGGTDFRDAIEALNKQGYRCDAVLIDAKRFVPQSRPRILIIAEHRSSPFGVLRPLVETDHLPSELRPAKLAKFLRENQGLCLGRFDFGALPPVQRNLTEVLERIGSKSDLWWESRRVEALLKSMRPIHKKRVRQLTLLKRGGVAAIYRRTRNGISVAEIRTDGLAGCLRTPRGGSSKQFLLVAKDGHVRVRNMTPREYARLQGVSDSFEIGSDVNKALFGFGDAVCVPAIRWIAEQVFRGAVEAQPQEAYG